jgi:regulator of replication initiation timing
MEKLRRELNEIKASLQGTHINPKKENEALKLENTQLKVNIDQLTKENEELRTKMQPAVESIMLGDSK